MKHLHFLLCALAMMLCAPMQANDELVWKMGDPLLTEASQITSNNSQNGFPPSNLLLPESEGYGTNQKIWHSAWSDPTPPPAGTDTYLQVQFKEAEQHIFFKMIGSMWNATYDTPTDVIIQGANQPDGEWTEIIHLENMEIDFDSFRPDKYTSPHIDLGAEYTYLRFVVKKTINAGNSSRYDVNGNPYVSLGRFQVYKAYLGEPDPIGPTWIKEEALLTDPSQITANSCQNGFPTDNLLRPESDGVGVNQYIWHTAWSDPAPLPANTDPYLQVHFNKAETDIIFTMLGTTWGSACDTPTEVIIQGANLPDGDWTEIVHLENMAADFTAFSPDRYESPHIAFDKPYTDVRFVVKKTINASRSDRYDANGNPFVSLGRFQVYRAVEGDPNPIDQKDNINLLFIGNSITAGATLSNPSTQAPPIVCGQLVGQATGVQTNVYNGGHSGITTFGFLPGRDDFTRVLAAARAFQKNNGGLIYFSIMLGTNDSACTTTEGAPVAPETYIENMRKIINALIAGVPGCKIIVNYPIWYSPNTYNGAMYLQEGLDRLHSYYPYLDALIAEYDQVYAGNRGVWEFFEDNKVLFTKEAGNAGDFFLHPNVNGAQRLAEIWANSLLELIKADGVEVPNPLPEWNTFRPSNNKKYTFSTPRGQYGTKDGIVTNTVKTGIGATEGEFAVITYEDKTYLYSIADKKFAYRDPVPYQDDWSNILVSDAAADPVKIHYTGVNANFPYCLTIEGYIANSADITTYGVVVNTYNSATDGGNQTAFQEVGDFDPTEALEILKVCLEKQDKPIKTITLPTNAKLTIYRAPEEKANGKAVIIAPGGGYAYVAGSYEGGDWAPLYNDLGFTAAVLTYNLPNGNPEVPLNDGRAALQYLRDNAEDLLLDPKRIGVMGFSAGGHLASTIATHLTGEELPAFQVLFYPVISMETRYTHAGSRQNLLGDNPSDELVALYSNDQQVTAETPPAYMCWATDDGTVKPINSTKYKAALSKAEVSVTSKTFPSGGHGFGFKTTFKYHKQMVESLTEWLKNLDDIIVSIGGIKETDLNSAENGQWYNLSGQAVSNPRNGIFVTQNKKKAIR